MSAPGTEERRLEDLAWSVHAADCSDPPRCDKHGWRCCTACTKLRQKLNDEFHRLVLAGEEEERRKKCRCAVPGDCPGEETPGCKLGWLA